MLTSSEGHLRHFEYVDRAFKERDCCSLTSTVQTWKQTLKGNRDMRVLTVCCGCAPSHSCEGLSEVCFDSLDQGGGGFVCFCKLASVGCQ